MAEIVLTEDMKKVMLDAANDAYPSEACGIVAGGVCHRLPNWSEHPEDSFILHAEDIARATDFGPYAGIWHSHPSGATYPSRRDWANHPPAKALVVVTRTEVNVFYADTEG